MYFTLFRTFSNTHVRVFIVNNNYLDLLKFNRFNELFKRKQETEFLLGELKKVYYFPQKILKISTIIILKLNFAKIILVIFMWNVLFLNL